MLTGSFGFGSPSEAYRRGSGDQHSRASLNAESTSLATTGCPQIDPCALDPLAGVVNEKSPEVRAANVELDVSGQRKESWIRRHNSRPNVATAACRSREAILSDPDGHWIAKACRY